MYIAIIMVIPTSSTSYKRSHMKHLPLDAALVEDVDGLVPAAGRSNLRDGSAHLVADLEVDARLFGDQAQNGLVAVLDGLHEGVPAAVELVGVAAVLQQELEDLGVFAMSSQGLDDGQMLAGGVDVDTALLDQELDDVAVVLPDGRGQGREDAAVLVLDGHAGRDQELHRLQLASDDSHLHDTLEGARLGQDGQDALQDRRVADSHAHGPVLAADVGVGASGEEDVDHVDAALADGRGQRRVALGGLVVGVHAVVQEPVQGLHVVDAHGRLDDALGRVEVGTGGNQLREILQTVVRDALESGILTGRDVGVSAAGQEQLEDVVAVVSDRGAQRRVDAVLLGVGVDAGLEQGADRLEVVDAGGQLHDAGTLLVVGAVGEQHLQTRRLVGGGPQHVLGAGQVGVGAVVEQAVDDVDARVLDGLEQRRLALLALEVGVGAVVEEQVDELLGRLLVGGADDERVAAGGQLVRVAAVDEQQVHQVGLVADGGFGERRLVVLADLEVGVGAVLEQRHGGGERAALDGGQERAEAVPVRGVRVRAEEQQQPHALGVAVLDGLLEHQVVGAGVGRHAAVQQLLDQLVVLAAHGRQQRALEVGRLRAGLAAGVPPGHAGRVGLEPDHLVAGEVQPGDLLEAELGRFRHARVRARLVALVKGAHAVEGARGARVVALVGADGAGRVTRVAAVLAVHGVARPGLLVVMLRRGALDPGQRREWRLLRVVDAVAVHAAMLRVRDAVTLDAAVLRRRRRTILRVVPVRHLGPRDARAAVDAVQRGGQPRVPDAHLLLDLLVAQAPLEHQRAHAQALARATQGIDHLLDVVVAKDLAPAAAHAAHGALALVLQEPAQHLVQQLEVGLGHAELLAQLRDDVGGEGLGGADTLTQPGLDGEEDLAGVEEVVGERVQPVRLLGDGAEVLEHADGHAVADARGLVAELQTLRLGLVGRGHDGALLGGEGPGQRSGRALVLEAAGGGSRDGIAAG
ncbi:hypothetical protein QQX98_004664, partial [Neonectria punicea]